MIVKLLTEHHLEFRSLKGGCTASSESTLVKMPHCWKSSVTAQLLIKFSEKVSYSYFSYVIICLILYILLHILGYSVSKIVSFGKLDWMIYVH